MVAFSGGTTFSPPSAAGFTLPRSRRGSSPGHEMVLTEHHPLWYAPVIPKKFVRSAEKTSSEFLRCPADGTTVLLGRREQFSMPPTDAPDAKSRNALNLILKGTVLYKSPAGNALLGPTMQGPCSLSKPIYVAPVEEPKGFIRKNRLLSTAELFADTDPDGTFL